MTIDEMFNELKNKVRDTYIVTLKYKYDFEKNYTIENHILEYDSTVDRYDWLDDWYEGQTDVEVLGYRLLSDIDNKKLEPCEDAISREETLNKINALVAKYIPLMIPGWTLPLEIARTICGMPSVTPQQKVGKWMPHMVNDKDESIDHDVCSECHTCFYGERTGDWKYCPNCGADMRGDSE
jgi:hypothetical protein